jgi:mannose-6-phosphate isomerase-like protein (cupin superfamily)
MQDLTPSVTVLSWGAASLDEIPPDWEIPLHGKALQEDEAYEQVVARDPAAGKRWTELEQAYPGIWDRFRDHGIRRFFGIKSFGIAAYTSKAGDAAIVPHSEEAYGQEELYIVVRGRARFTCDCEGIELERGGLLFVRPAVYREALALATPTTVLVVGGVPGSAYEPPPFRIDHAGG